MHAHMCIYACTYIPWIHKFVIATVGCGISHKDTKLMQQLQNKNNTKTK